MSVRTISEMTFWSGLAMKRLGRDAEAETLFQSIAGHAANLRTTPPAIDYFATSLPAMLLFEDDLEKRNLIEADFLSAQALLGLNETQQADQRLQSVLQRDANHAAARDLLQFLHLVEQATVAL